MVTLGVDISHHQGDVDFTAVRRAGYQFVIAKATEGVVMTDPKLAANRVRARAAGLVVGFYHFAGSSANRRMYDPVAEADFFCRAIGQLEPGELVALDYEPGAHRPADPPAWCRAWLDRVQAKLGVKPLIYMNQSDARSSNWAPVTSGDNALWLARYDGSHDNPGAIGAWTGPAIKQFTSTGRVPGIGGNADLNAFYGDLNQLLRYGAGGAPVLEDDMPDFDSPLFTDNFGTPQQRTIRFRDALNEIRESAHLIPTLVTQVSGLQTAVSSLAQAVASGRDDLTAEELEDVVDRAIQKAGAAVLAAQEAARASNRPA